MGATPPTGKDEEVHAPGSIESLAEALIYQLAHGRPVALGFEMPLMIPVPEAPRDLGKARPCDAGRTPWSQSAGASVMATGLVQLAWLLNRVLDVTPATAVHLDWDRFRAERTGLFLWEAFVNGPDKDPVGSDEADALIGVRAFCSQLPNPGDVRANTIERPLSLAAVAAAWAGRPLDRAALRASVMVVRPSPERPGRNPQPPVLRSGQQPSDGPRASRSQEDSAAARSPQFIEPELPGGPFLLIAQTPPGEGSWEIGPFLRSDFLTAPDGSIEYADGPDHPIGLRVRAQEGDVIHANNGSHDLMSYKIVPWDPITRTARPWGWSKDSVWARDGQGPLYRTDG